MAVSQSLARPARTGVQLVGAAVIVEFVDAFFLNFTDRQYAAALALLTLVLGYVQVIVEDRAGKAFLRKPSPPAQPVDAVEVRRNEVGAYDTGSLLFALACIVVIICGAVWLVNAL